MRLRGPLGNPFSFVFLFTFFLDAHSQTAAEIVQQADQKMRGETSQSLISIRIIRPSWTRELRMKTWMKGRDQALLIIQSPSKEKGIAFLKRKKEVWNWIPALEKVMKLPPSMMSQSWMGTDFTNDDLVRESSVVVDYSHRMLGDTLIEERPCYMIECIPLPNTAVVWGKLKICIDKNDLMELFVAFYDEDGTLVNIMRAHDVKIMDSRMIPTRMEMIPVDKPGQRTEIIYHSILFDKPIDNSLFTLEQMRKPN